MDRANRVILGLVGLVLIALAVAGILAATGVLTLDRPGQVYQRVSSAVLDRRAIWLTVIGLVALLCVLLGLRAAWRQLPGRVSSSGPRTLTLDRSERGRTTLSPTALARAVAADFRRVPQVSDAQVRMVSDGRVPRMHARLDTTPGADLRGVRTASDAVWERARQTLGAERVDGELQLRPLGPASRVD